MASVRIPVGVRSESAWTPQLFRSASEAPVPSRPVYVQLASWYNQLLSYRTELVQRIRASLREYFR